MARRSLRERLYEKILVSETGCLLWVGTKDQNGYGRIHYINRPHAAHRVVYELVRGPIPPGLTLDHLCRVRACVNPRHLEPVTNQVNLLRGNAMSAVNAKKTHCRKGHPYDLLNTRIDKHGWRWCRKCHYEDEQRRRRLGIDSRTRKQKEKAQISRFSG